MNCKRRTTPSKSVNNGLLKEMQHARQNCLVAWKTHAIVGACFVIKTLEHENSMQKLVQVMKLGTFKDLKVNIFDQ